MTSIAQPLSASVHELVARFVQSSHPVMKDLLVIRSYRGDGTETGERRLRAMMGAKYDSLHCDTVACNGRVVVVLPRFKAPGAVDAPFSFRLLTAEHHWALSEVDEKSPEVTHARPETVQRVPVEISQELHAFPDFEFVEVRNVNYWESGRTTKRKKKAAPKDVVYFRFTGGYGVVAC